MHACADICACVYAQVRDPSGLFFNYFPTLFTEAGSLKQTQSSMSHKVARSRDSHLGHSRLESQMGQHTHPGFTSVLLIQILPLILA